MCGRFLTPDQAALERYWELKAPADFVQSYNVAPSQLAPVVRMDKDGQLQIHMLVWGYQPDWAKRAWINARSETVFTVKAFATAAHKHRCLVPAMGWYEWQGKEAPRRPFVFHRNGFAPFAFAGIWTARKTPDGWVRSFAILTTQATGALREIHDRKPVVLDREHHTAWLAPATPVEDLQAILRVDFAGISTYEISTYVNKPEHNDAQVIQPAEAKG
jgi:putative SOS response-associated peptidase YedK